MKSFCSAKMRFLLYKTSIMELYRSNVFYRKLWSINVIKYVIKFIIIRLIKFIIIRLRNTILYWPVRVCAVLLLFLKRKQKFIYRFLKKQVTGICSSMLTRCLFISVQVATKHLVWSHVKSRTHKLQPVRTKCTMSLIRPGYTWQPAPREMVRGAQVRVINK